MDGWMDGQTDGWMDGWSDRWFHLWTDRWMDDPEPSHLISFLLNLKSINQILFVSTKIANTLPLRAS